MYKTVTKTEKICRWSLYLLMLIFTSYMLYLRYGIYSHLSNTEFKITIWSNNWYYLIGIIFLSTFLYIRSNLTAFREMLKK